MKLFNSSSETETYPDFVTKQHCSENERGGGGEREREREREKVRARARKEREREPMYAVELIHI